ncbi:cuticle protein AM/CP1114-like [Penaeus monodon]|uniref:cuticle protein AM/CP1114-like n=1 Tax=Penaeus monodon TaxID=6687 RepID=UPI0018A72DAB|nr:cuticle protein AM/CP1114-like [Penaeus monodon]
MDGLLFGRIDVLEKRPDSRNLFDFSLQPFKHELRKLLRLLYCISDDFGKIPGSRALVAVAAAAPQQQPPVAILLAERVFSSRNGAYSFQFQAENGIVQSETGTPGVLKARQMCKEFSVSPGKTAEIAEVRYQADENGFQAQSPSAPFRPRVPSPIPQFVLDQIAFAEEQDRLEAQLQFQ